MGGMSKRGKKIQVEEQYVAALMPVLSLLNMSLSEFVNAHLRRAYMFMLESGLLDKDLDFRTAHKAMDEYLRVVERNSKNVN